jgi:FixJ family two-component response regulator
MTEPTVFVVDDDEPSRGVIEWLMKPLGLRVEGYASAQTFLDAYDPSRPGCLVCDVRMPGMSGLELLETLAAMGASLPVIFTTAHADVQTALRAMKLKAEDMLEKPYNPQILLEWVQKAIRKDAESRRDRAHIDEINTRLARLTAREREVLDLVVAGRSNKQMAFRLHVSEKTIEAHRAQVMKKLDAESVAELVRMVLTVEKHPSGSLVNR